MVERGGECGDDLPLPLLLLFDNCAEAIAGYPKLSVLILDADFLQVGVPAVFDVAAAPPVEMGGDRCPFEAIL